METIQLLTQELVKTAAVTLEAALPVFKDGAILAGKVVGGCVLLGIALPVVLRLVYLAVLVTEQTIRLVSSGASAAVDAVGSVPGRVANTTTQDETQ